MCKLVKSVVLNGKLFHKLTILLLKWLTHLTVQFWTKTVTLNLLIPTNLNHLGLRNSRRSPNQHGCLQKREKQTALGTAHIPSPRHTEIGTVSFMHRKCVITLITGYFGTKTFRHQDSSAPVQNGSEVSRDNSAPDFYWCRTFRTLRHQCRNTSRHFGTIRKKYIIVRRGLLLVGPTRLYAEICLCYN